jgi:hypothetical protein
LQPLQAYCVDHDHACCDGPTSCGKCVRGFICSKCNRLLGCAEDSMVRLCSAIEYLKKWIVNHE